MKTLLLTIMIVALIVIGCGEQEEPEYYLGVDVDTMLAIQMQPYSVGDTITWTGNRFPSPPDTVTGVSLRMYDMWKAGFMYRVYIPATNSYYNHVMESSIIADKDQ